MSARPCRLAARVLPYPCLLVLAAGCGGTGARPHARGGGPVPGAARAGARDRGAGAPARRFPIRWVRRPPVGTRFGLRVEATSSRRVRRGPVGGAPREERSEQAWQLDAVVEVAASSPARRVLRYAVHRFARTTGGVRRELLRAGSVLEITQVRGRGWVSRDGRPLERRTVAELARVVELGLPPPGQDDDALFGSRRPRAPGDRWAPGVAPLARALGQPAERVSGEVSLRARATVDGLQCLVLRYAVQVAGGGGDAAQPGRPGSLAVRIEGEASLPLERPLPAIRASLVRREERVVLEPPATRVESWEERTRREERVPLPAAPAEVEVPVAGRRR